MALRSGHGAPTAPEGNTMKKRNLVIAILATIAATNANAEWVTVPGAVNATSMTESLDHHNVSLIIYTDADDGCSLNWTIMIHGLEGMPNETAVDLTARVDHKDPVGGSFTAVSKTGKWQATSFGDDSGRLHSEMKGGDTIRFKIEDNQSQTQYTSFTLAGYTSASNQAIAMCIPVIDQNESYFSAPDSKNAKFFL